MAVELVYWRFGIYIQRFPTVRAAELLARTWRESDWLWAVPIAILAPNVGEVVAGPQMLNNASDEDLASWVF